MTRIFLCAGDTSGELHAAAFVRALRTRLPETHFLGLGGVEMERRVSNSWYISAILRSVVWWKS